MASGQSQRGSSSSWRLSLDAVTVGRRSRCLALVLAHNVWAADWRILITLLGWLTAIGGAARIVVPQGTQRLGRRVLAHPQGRTIAAVIWLAIGAVLCFFGYVR